MSNSFTLPFIKKEQVAKRAWTFYFDKRVSSNYAFLPGQYTKVTLPITASDGKGSYRFFTTASSPLEEFFIITTTIPRSDEMSDFKKAFFALKTGKQVEFFGPMGGFFLPEEDKTPRVLLSGGIGITPFRSMILYAAEKQRKIPFTLIASFSKEEDMVFKNELLNAAEKNKNIKVKYITERFTEDILNTQRLDLMRSNLNKPIYMVSGKPEMIDSTVEMLEKMGVEESKIKTDIFTGY